MSKRLRTDDSGAVRVFDGFSFGLGFWILERLLFALVYE